MTIGSIRTNGNNGLYTASDQKVVSKKNCDTIKLTANNTEYNKQLETKIFAKYDDKKIYKHGDVDIAKERLFNRTKVTEALNNLLKENGVEVPRDASMTFSIDPYDYELKVSGLDDEVLASKVEKVLNSGENSKNLYTHIYTSGNGSDYVKSEQLPADQCKKLSLYLEVKNNTGYDLRDCVSKDGTFYAPDGTDVIEAYKNSKKIPEAFRADVISTYVPRIKELANKGFDSIGDLVLQIEYKDGNLYDIGQKNGYGPGQTEWIDNLVSQYGDGLFRKPVNKITLDSKNPAISDLLKQNGIELPNDTTLNFSYFMDSKFLSISGTDDISLLSKLQYMFFQPTSIGLLQYLSSKQQNVSFDVSL